MRPKSSYQLLLAGIIVLAAGLCLERWGSLQTHALISYGTLEVVKRNQQMTLNGSTEMVFSRAPLARGMLHLNPWYGHQDVRSRRPEQLASLLVDVELADRAEFTLYWSYQDGRSEGLKLSAGGPALHVATDDLGGYRQRVVLEEKVRAGDFAISIKPGATGLLATINDREYKLASEFRLGHWGLLGGAENTPVRVDTVSLERADGSTSDIDFAPSLNLLLLGAIVGVLGSVVICCTRWRLEVAYFHLVFFAFLLAADYFVIIPRPVDGYLQPMHERDRRTDLLQSYERLRTGVLESVRPVWPSLHRSYLPAPYGGGVYTCVNAHPCAQTTDDALAQSLAGTTERILYVGSSQTVGAGATTFERTFSSVAHRQLSAGRNLATINIAFSGIQLGEMTERFVRYAPLVKPTLIVLNSGFNQPPNSAHAEKLNAFVAAARRLAPGAKLVLVQEANDLPDLGMRYRDENQFAARRFKLPLVDLYAHIRSLTARDAGRIWWDIVHFQDYGHAEAGKLLAHELRPLLTKH